MILYYILRTVGNDIDRTHRSRKARKHVRKAQRKQSRRNAALKRHAASYEKRQAKKAAKKAAKFAENAERTAGIQGIAYSDGTVHYTNLVCTCKSEHRFNLPMRCAECGQRHAELDSQCPNKKAVVFSESDLDAVVNQATALLLAGTDNTTVAGYIARQSGIAEAEALDILLSVVSTTGLTSENITSKTVTNTGSKA